MGINNPVSIAAVGGCVALYQGITLVRADPEPLRGVALVLHLGVIAAGIVCLVGGVLRVLGRRK